MHLNMNEKTWYFRRVEQTASSLYKMFFVKYMIEFNSVTCNMNVQKWSLKPLYLNITLHFHTLNT